MTTTATSPTTANGLTSGMRRTVSLLKDTANRLGDLLDDGKVNRSFEA